MIAFEFSFQKAKKRQKNSVETRENDFFFFQ